MIRAGVLLAAFAFVAACASLTEEQCQRGDWYAIGVQDGAKGRLLSYFSQHVKACTKHNVLPEEEPWREGRERGLRFYCTPPNAYNIGRSGRRPSPVCTVEEAAAMSTPNSFGLKYYDLTQEINELEQDVREINDTLLEIGNPDDPLYVALLLDRSRLKRRIRRLELQRMRYDSWP